MIKRFVWMAGAGISREKSLPWWLGCVFLEKNACLDGWPDLSEIQEISPEFSFIVFDCNSYVEVVILGNLCGGGFQDSPRTPGQPCLSGWLGRVFSAWHQYLWTLHCATFFWTRFCSSLYRFFFERDVTYSCGYLDTLLYFEKNSVFGFGGQKK